MDEYQPRTTGEWIAGLMAAVGIGLVLGSVPCGLSATFQDYGRNKDYWSLVYGTSVLISMGGICVLLFWGGLAIQARLRRKRGENPHA